MSFDADYLVDRRRLKRSLTWWRVLAILALVLAVTAAVGRFTGVSGVAGKAHVARMAVDGIIVDNDRRDQALAEIADNARVKALIVRVNSPGGTVVGGEALYHHLRTVAEKKPVVVVMGEVAASAAYMTALGGDHILAREGTVTGSIGILLQSTDLTGLLDKLGIKPESVKSTPLKAQPNPLESFTPEARETAEAVVRDLYEMFVGLVADRRDLSREQAFALADGRVYTGRQAVANGLVDALDGEPEAREWLAESHGIPASVPVQDVDLLGPEEKVRRLIGQVFGKTLFSERLRLDGLISVWHPEL